MAVPRVPVNSQGHLSANLYLPRCTPGADEGCSARRPAVVLIHGGGWFKGDLCHPLAQLAGEWLAERGIVVVSVRYRLLGEAGAAPAGFGVEWCDANRQYSSWSSELADCRARLNSMYAAIRDSRAAARWLLASASALELGVEPGCVVAMGHSSGANTALALAASPPGDFTIELAHEDPTLASIRVNGSARLAGGVLFSTASLPFDVLEANDTVTNKRTKWSTTMTERSHSKERKSLSKFVELITTVECSSTKHKNKDGGYTLRSHQRRRVNTKRWPATATTAHFERLDLR